MNLLPESEFKHPRNIIAILGPTASGKTSLALQLAEAWNTEILSADSRQCYAEMAIGTAVPDSKDLDRIPHHFIQSCSIQDTVNASTFEQLALHWSEKLFTSHAVGIVCGGTGLYVQAFLNGLDPVPAISAEIRTRLEAAYKEFGLSWLQHHILQKDPGHNLEKDWLNPRRLIRALEVLESTGQPLRTFQQNLPVQREFRSLKIGLTLPKPELRHRMAQRIEQMLHAGWLLEAARLLPYKDLPALQTVGYPELFEVLEGTLTLEQAIPLIETRTWQYAKRQLTWFKKDPSIQWFHPSDTAGIETALNTFLGNS